MHDVTALIGEHGPLLLAGLCFIEAIGFPLPAAVGLLCAGAMARVGSISAPGSFAAGIAGLLAGDLLLFAVGRYTGWYFLGLLCRLAASPESCIHNAAHRFYRQGRLALLFAKFVPGVNTMAAPLAGSLGMRPREFLLFDLGGALIYASAYFALGFVFSAFLGTIAAAMASAGQLLKAAMILAAAAYLVYRGWLAWKLRATFLDVPRIGPQALASILAGNPEETVVFDVRSHGYYSGGALRIRGAARLEPNRLGEALEELPGSREIYLYCT